MSARTLKYDKGRRSIAVGDCPNCGGTHFGSFKCPFTTLPCVVCGIPTISACSDCAIEGKGSVHVCKNTACRDEHERQNPQHPVLPLITGKRPDALPTPPAEEE
jgi:hypothetical protein